MRVYLTRYYMQVSALETQKSFHFQTNPSPPPSCCIQVDVWPVISASVEETCGHLMTPTGVTHAIALDGAMTVCFNISLYILGEMRGIFSCFLRSAKVLSVSSSLKQHAWSRDSSYVNQPPVDGFFCCVWFKLHWRVSGKLIGWWIERKCVLLWLLHISFSSHLVGVAWPWNSDLRQEIK